MNKKLVSVIAAFTAACSFQAAVGAASFSDISGNQYAWCAGQIKEMADAGYINGYEDGTYRPDNSVSKLEGIALFARMMGSADKANEEVLALAHNQYDSALKACSLAWGSDELAYLMYKGAFTAADLTTYIKGSTKDEPLTRGEAAVIITKAMGAESEVTQASSVSLTYKDTASISKSLLPYVDYVTKNSIMNGIDDAFEPNGKVTRSQIAVMLSRVNTACDYSFIRGKLVSVDETESKVTVSVSDKETTYTYNNTTDFRVQGDITYASSLTVNAGVLLTFKGDKLVSVDTLSDQPEETITVIYSGYSTVGGVYQIRVKESENSSTTKTYECIADVPVTREGTYSNVKSLTAGDSIQLELANGKVQSITAGSKTEKITGATVTAIDINGDQLTLTISSSDSNYDGKTYTVSDTASATKNGKDITLADVYIGDKVTLTLKYGVVSKVEATSTVNTVSGNIVSILIATQPSMTLRVDGKDKTYQIPNDCTIVVNQKDASVYDLRVGDSVTVTTNSSAVTKITASTSVINSETGTLSGTVTAVNTSYGFLGVTSSGSDIPYTVFKTGNNTTVIDTKGKTVDFKSIKTGDVVECHGTTTNGAFTATLIIVTQMDN